MCWPFIEGPRLEGGIEVLERRAKYPGEPRRKRLNFVKSHSRSNSDEWDLVRPVSSLGSARGGYRPEMYQRQWQQPQYLPPLQHQQQQYQPQQQQLHYPPQQQHQYLQPQQGLGFHGPDHHQQFLEPQHQQFHEVAPGVQQLDWRDDNGPLEEFGRPRGGGGDLSPRIIQREPRARMPHNYQSHHHRHRSHSRGREPRRANSVTTYSGDTYTDYSRSHYGGGGSGARSLYSESEDTVMDYERPLKHYPRKRSRSRRRYHH